MAEPLSLVLAALATGIVEGNSVLKHYQDVSGDRDNNKKKSSFIFPSILYGAIALPMSLIGESPGPTIISSLAPSLRMQTVEEYEEGIKKSLPPSSSPNESSVSLSQSSNVSQIHLTRKENRMLLEQMKKNPMIRATQTRATTKWSQYFATLGHQKTLVTPLAETMRRMRVVMVGVGLFSAYWQYQSKQQQQLEPGSTTTSKLTSFESLLQTTAQHNGGVVLRLIPPPNQKPPSATTYQADDGRIPVVCSASASSDFEIQPSTFPHMHLRNDSKLLSSLSPDYWLTKTTKNFDKQKFLLVEANLSVPLAECFRPGSSSMANSKADQALLALAESFHPTSLHNPSAWTDQVLFATQHIAASYREKSNNSDRRIYSVLVSLGRPTTTTAAGDASTTIHIDASNELASVIVRTIHKYLLSEDTEATNLLESSQQEDDSRIPKLVDGDGEELNTNEATLSSYDIFGSIGGWIRRETVGRMTTIVESIGLRIRKGIQFSTGLLGAIFTRSDTRRKEQKVHIISDNAFFVQWVASDVLPIDKYSIAWTQPSNSKEIEDYLQLPGDHDDSLSIVCCSSDEKTACTVRSIISSRGKDTKVLALMDNLWMQEKTKEIIAPLEPSSLQILNTQTIYKGIFQDAQTMLMSGNSPEEIIRHFER